METCGICLVEDDGRAIRGRIDGCDHFFCFVCIMEWAKVESRCPMCKTRFSTIRRSPKLGIFAHERVVHVPVRDQVYHPLGNGTTGPSDPYAETRCVECQSSKDEHLLLLCDLCDSAAHTYCAGLGATVPEGDWYCHDCSVSKNEHSNSQIDSESCDQDSSIGFNTVRLVRNDISVLDIIRDEATVHVAPQHGRTASQTCENQSRSDRPSGMPIAGESQDSQSSRTTVHADQGARTLNRCRNLHGRIRVLRENWNSLRSGSMSFSSNGLDSGRACNNRIDTSRALTSANSSQQKSSSSVNFDSVSSNTLNETGSYDVARAWKMMDIAKSVERSRGGIQVNLKNPDHPDLASKRKLLAEARNASGSSIMSNSKSPGKALVGTPLCNNHQYYSVEVLHQDHKRQKYEQQKTGRVMMNDAGQINKGPSGPSLREHLEMKSTKMVWKLSHEDACQENRNFGSVDAQQVASCSTSVTDPLLEGAKLPVNGLKPISSSHCKSKVQEDNRNGTKNTEGTLKKDDGAKSEVQSLVKLNLKLLSSGKKLGADKFKEIAKLATHTILAACGLEHSKAIVYSPPLSMCKHVVPLQARRASDLMPNSCRECFYVFVKDVVHSIMNEKISNDTFDK